MTDLRRRAFVALMATLAIQVYTALAATGMSVLAPVVAPEFGVSPKLVGVFIGMLYAASTAASLFSGTFIVRHGAIRVSQAAVLLCACGLLLVPIAAWSGVGVALVVIAAFMIGAGYGPITPASSQILSRTAPPERMALTFSIKQTGVPAGAALGGALLPSMSLLLGWHAALLAIAALGIVVAFAAQPIRSELDAGRERGRRHSIAGILKPLRKLVRNPMLVELTLVSFFYAALQVSLMAFLVVYLTEALGWSLVPAGLALTVATVAGVAGRILWGMVADHLLPPRRVLGLIGILAGIAAVATALYPGDWPVLPLLLLAAAFGGTAIGWNGVQLAEVARHSPPGEVGPTTGAASFIGFSGVVIGPPLFGLLASATGYYATGFIVMGAAAGATGGVVLLRDHRARRSG